MPFRNRRPSRNYARPNTPANAVVTVGAETGGDTRVCAVQLKDPNYNDLTSPGTVFAYLSDDAAGQSIAASAPSGGWAVGTDGLLIPVVANKAAYFTSEADGDIDISIVEATTKTFYLVIVLPDGSHVVTAVAFA